MSSPPVYEDRVSLVRGWFIPGKCRHIKKEAIKLMNVSGASESPCREYTYTFPFSRKDQMFFVSRGECRFCEERSELHFKKLRHCPPHPRPHVLVHSRRLWLSRWRCASPFPWGSVSPVQPRLLAAPAAPRTVPGW